MWHRSNISIYIFQKKDLADNKVIHYYFVLITYCKVIQYLYIVIVFVTGRIIWAIGASKIRHIMLALSCKYACILLLFFHWNQRYRFIWDVKRQDRNTPNYGCFFYFRYINPIGLCDRSKNTHGFQMLICHFLYINDNLHKKLWLFESHFKC